MIIPHPHAARTNAIVLLMTEGGTKVLSLLSFALMARGLSQHAYGTVAFAFAVGSLFYIFFNFGLENHLVREVRKRVLAHDAAGVQETVSAAAVLKIASVPVFIGVLLLVAWMLQWERTQMPIIVAVFVYFYLLSAAQLVFSFLRAFERMTIECGVRWIQGIAVFGAVAVYGYWRPDVRLLAWWYAGIAGMAVLMAMWLFARITAIIPIIRLRIQRRALVLLGETKYLFLMGIAISVYSSSDVLIISRMLGVETVALYRNAVMITMALFMIPSAVVNGFFPQMIQCSERHESFYATLRGLMVRLLTIGICMACGLYLAAPVIIPLIFGHQYLAAIPLFRYSLIALLCTMMNYVLAHGMMALGEYRAYFLYTAGAAMLSIGMNVLLLPKIGILASVITMNTVHVLLTIVPAVHLWMHRARARACLGMTEMPSIGT
ncbi:oligosaccharide flippase family protein [Candidatus Uhrbacteria bacterium]|nr:oligosaccharide flippase family protein [Candidatus Uhrbacteria bacterium]